MKKNYFILAWAMILMLLSLTSCSGGIKGDEVKTLTADFFGAVRAEDWDSAKTYLHPALDDLDMKAYFLEVEETYGLDFQEAFKVDRYTNFQTFFTAVRWTEAPTPSPWRQRQGRSPSFWRSPPSETTRGMVFTTSQLPRINEKTEKDRKMILLRFFNLAFVHTEQFICPWKAIGNRL